MTPGKNTSITIRITITIAITIAITITITITITIARAQMPPSAPTVTSNNKVSNNKSTDATHGAHCDKQQ